MYAIFDGENNRLAWPHLSGFAFGASTIALFARVGGGIYTKAADVGADLVGKVEEDLDEDSADNPATIADNVGDNVGDVAGMGADLFESYCGSLIAAATLGADEFPNGKRGVALPFYVAGFGALASIVGTFCVRTAASPTDMQVEGGGHLDARQREAKRSEMILESLLWSIRRAIGVSSVLVVGLTAFSVAITFGNDREGWQMMICVIIGLFCGNFIGYFTEYATSYTYYPTQSIAIKSNTGPATVLIQGLGVGMLSTVPPVFFVVITMLAAYYIGHPHGFYGISITAVGMLSTLGMTLATDAFGPVADNAGGIAEMAPESEISRDVRDRTDALDALGNTTAATGKGFAIGSAVLTALALMRAFAEQAGVASRALGAQPTQGVVDILNPVVLPGILLGAMLPFVFAALTMLSVGKAAESVMWECRDQLNKKFFEKTPLAPAYCVRIVTLASLREMVLPGAIAVFSPIFVGVLLGAGGLLGLLSGSTSSGFLLGLMMSNAGGAWDNAKKYVEKGNLGEGKGKKSAQHKACVVGDTVGDPFKDTSGPALNILIKLMSIVCLVLVQRIGKNEWAADQWWYSLIILAILLVLIYRKPRASLDSACAVCC
jgi:K(+)-stimulated pyrophosphate-energized sodium pump